VIYSAFGSLSDFSHRLKISYAEISRELAIPYMTVYYTIQRLKEKYNSDLGYFMAVKKKRGDRRIRIKSPETEQYLLSEKCLREWMHLTLPQRSLKIKQIYGVAISKNTLRNFYIRNGVKQTPAYAKLYPNNKDPVRLENERIEFAMRMSEWIVEGRPVIYFDETTFNPDMH
jgi:hypothetical protein